MGSTACRIVFSEAAKCGCKAVSCFSQKFGMQSGPVALKLGLGWSFCLICFVSILIAVIFLRGLNLVRFQSIQGLGYATRGFRTGTSRSFEAPFS